MTSLSKKITIHRYPPTTNKSLQAWNAGDEYILHKLNNIKLTGKNVSIFNDRFGFLSCHLYSLDPSIVVHRKSQEKSIKMNLENNQLQTDTVPFPTLFSESSILSDISLLQIPKSLDLFRFFLHNVSQSLSDDGMVICAFMTKYFTPAMLEIAEEYFEEIEQSLARKKSRILILKKKKSLTEDSFINSVPFSFNDGEPEKIKQYPGVFSSGNIDYATQFLIDTLRLTDDDKTVLDLGSGNGVIARSVQISNPGAELHLMDDSILAVESSKLNVEKHNSHFHWSDSLKDLPKTGFEMIISNPPFHFGHETNIEVSLRLFKEVAEVLNTGGRFVCVANQHLNYKVHLDKLFSSVNILAQNKKFIIYEAS